MAYQRGHYPQRNQIRLSTYSYESFVHNKQNNKGIKSTKALSMLKLNTAFIQTLHHAQVHEGLINSVTSKFYPVKFSTTYTHKSICIKQTHQVHIMKSLSLLRF